MCVCVCVCTAGDISPHSTYPHPTHPISPYCCSAQSLLSVLPTAPLHSSLCTRPLPSSIFSLSSFSISSSPLCSCFFIPLFPLLFHSTSLFYFLSFLFPPSSRRSFPPHHHSLLDFVPRSINLSYPSLQTPLHNICSTSSIVMMERPTAFPPATD